MINLIFVISFYFCTYLISFINIRTFLSFDFFSKRHTMVLKGIAILLVVITHLGAEFGVRYVNPLGGIGVSIFLIISGYGINESYKNNGLENYWIKKIKKVFIPYFIIESIIMVVHPFFEVSLFEFLLGILLLKVNHPIGWYLQYLMVWYIIFYLINKFNFTEKIKLSIYFCFSFILIFSPNVLWAEQAFSFVIGFLISNYKTTKFVKKYLEEKNVTLMPMLLLVGIILIGVKQFDYIRNLPFVMYNIIELMIKLPLAIIIIHFSYNYQIFTRSNFLSKIGKYSYEIYLIHGYTILLFSFNSFVDIISFSLLTLILSLLLNVFAKTILK